MKSLELDITERSALLARATSGIDELITWAQEPSRSKMYPKSATWTHEACRCELDMHDVGSLDDLVTLYRSADDAAAVAGHVHADKVQTFSSFKAGGLHVALQWGIFQAPFPIMHDRDATFLECSKKFTDPSGRRGFARFITSCEMGSMGEGYVRVDLRAWGVVLLETADPNILHASTLVDVDWKGHVTTCTATRMTSRLAQSIKHLPSILRASKKDAQHRCSMCRSKPRMCDAHSKLTPCESCAKPLCDNCRGISQRLSGATACLVCVCKARDEAMTRSTAISDASTVESELRSPTAWEWSTEPGPVDLGYLSEYRSRPIALRTKK
ncbi:hypothetical protein SDRG_06146 [Saprolegnia diclina VS20]|uniref:START domain-containing protein n=1 Tax=Saprolegnia diclina (strain VS20) TaxID=1156394 RepID=T0QPP0_SAPDV|nr:hypothetical protein SDRG_06146 [Saprolegnia diclina VS20]EQC36711.1 hypothetical protein SDRG_06146 [Saprolegnia diclina VS20]|eukprot:XP_008610132.1 hypothetical protein SDRG_06146 [Saprolegnia diclina VS20]